MEGIGAALEPVEGGHDVLGAPNAEWEGLYAELGSGRLNLVRFLDVHRITEVDQNANAAKTRNSLQEEFEPFRCQVGRHDREAGYIASRQRETGDEATADRVTDHRRNDWDR